MFNRAHARLGQANSFYSTTDSYDTRTLLKARQDLNRAIEASLSQVEPAPHSESGTDDEENVGLELEGGRVKNRLNLFRSFLRRNRRVHPVDLKCRSAMLRPMRSLQAQAEEDTNFTDVNEVESKSGTNSDKIQKSLCRVQVDQTKTNSQELQLLEEDCASDISVCQDDMQIVHLTDLAAPYEWTLQQLYRKMLSNMVLANSNLILHPYYWHPMARRSLVEQFRKLYKSIEEKNCKGNKDQIALRRIIPDYAGNFPGQEQKQCKFQMIQDLTRDEPSMDTLNLLKDPPQNFFSGWSVSAAGPKNVEVEVVTDSDSDSLDSGHEA